MYGDYFNPYNYSLEETIMITMDLAVVRGGLSFYSYSHLWEMDSMVIVALMDSQ